MHNDVGYGSLGIQKERNARNFQGESLMLLQSTGFLPSMSSIHLWKPVMGWHHATGAHSILSDCIFFFWWLSVVIVLRWDHYQGHTDHWVSILLSHCPCPHFSSVPLLPEVQKLIFGLKDSADPVREETDGPCPLVRTGSVSSAS